jgi:hypothetical protein
MNQLCFLNVSLHCTKECICWLPTTVDDPKIHRCFLLRSVKGLNDLFVSNASQVRRMVGDPPPEIS